jgi:hypothetical protein
LEGFGLLKRQGNKYRGLEYSLVEKEDFHHLKDVIDKHLQAILAQIEKR